MRAIAVFPTAREVKLIDVEEPRITQPTEVKLRMLDVGICGTDKEICSFQYGAPPAGSEYLILGHESLGKVVEVGPEVHDIAVGDLVVTMVRRACPHAACHPCRANRPDFCATGDFTERGIKERHGFMAEYVVDEARYMHVVPARLRAAAVLTEPLTIAEKAFAQAVYIERRMPWLAAITPQSPERSELTAAILGAGAVGLLGAMALRAMGTIHLFLGVESASAERLAYLGRTHVPHQNVSALAACRAASIVPSFNFMLFDPDSSDGDSGSSRSASTRRACASS